MEFGYETKKAPSQQQDGCSPGNHTSGTPLPDTFLCVPKEFIMDQLFLDPAVW
jgi:hypothetical protein